MHENILKKTNSLYRYCVIYFNLLSIGMHKSMRDPDWHSNQICIEMAHSRSGSKVAITKEACLSIKSRTKYQYNR